jgi:hypothetical protein
MITSIQDVAFVAGIILGACLLAAVSWVWMRKQVLGASGISLAVIGFALVGLTVWTSIRIEASPDGGFIAQFEQRLNELNEMIEGVDSNVQMVASTSLEVSAEVEGLREVVAANGTQFEALTRELQRANTVAAPALDDIRGRVVIPQQDTNAVELRNRQLEAIIGR